LGSSYCSSLYSDRPLLMGRPQKIAIQTIGTRGDTQPFIAIGVALKKAGYDVYVFACSNHMSICADAGLTGVPVFQDAEKELKENKKVAQSMADGNTLTFLAGAGEFAVKHGREALNNWFEAMESVKPDLLLVGTLGYLLDGIAAYKLKVPVIHLTLQTICENPTKMMFGLPTLPCGLNRRAIHFSIKHFVYPEFRKAFNEACFELKGYRPCDFWTPSELCTTLLAPEFPLFVGVSPLVAKEIDPTPHPNVRYVGHFGMPSETQIETATQARGSGIFGSAATMECIKQFIAKGKKPVYMGWGSMTARSPEAMVELVAKAVKLAGSRAIVYQGWAELGAETLQKATKDQELLKYAEDNLLFVGKTPHDWLFPQCSAIVHHGGSGTMSTAARSGTPQIITPIFLDQWEHAFFLNKFGAGHGFEKKQLMRLTAKEIGEAIKKVESDAGMKAKAAEWAEICKAENGPQQVVDYVEEFWTNQVETGIYEQTTAARFAANEKEASRCCR